MLSTLTPPARLAPLDEMGDEICAYRLLRGIDLDPRLAFQCDDIVVDEGACTLPLQGQGKPFAIRCFKGDMRLKLWLVLFGDIDDPPELVYQPVCLEVTTASTAMS